MLWDWSSHQNLLSVTVYNSGLSEKYTISTYVKLSLFSSIVSLRKFLRKNGFSFIVPLCGVLYLLQILYFLYVQAFQVSSSYVGLTFLFKKETDSSSPHKKTANGKKFFHISIKRYNLYLFREIPPKKYLNLDRSGF